MNSGQNNRTKLNSSRKVKRTENILKFYLFTVVLVGLATGFIFTFKISYLLISTLIISVSFIVYFYYNSSEKHEYYYHDSNDNDEIKFNHPRSNKDESKLVELERKSLNFVISDFEEKTSKIDINEEVRSTYNENSAEESSSDENLKEIKKRYNPYKSPFEPINSPETQTESINESIIYNTESVPYVHASVITEKIDQDQDTGISSSNETIKLDTDNCNQLVNKFDEKINRSEYEDDSDSDHEEQEFEDNDSFENEAINVVQFRPRVIENSQDDTAIIKSSDPNTVVSDEDYECPPYVLLRHENYIVESELQLEEQEIVSNKLIDTLASFGVGAKVVDVSVGPSVTRYELQPNPGVKVSKIVGLSDDIALNLAATGVRIEAPIPGKAAVGIEVPNKEITPVLFGDVINSAEFTQHRSKLAFALGKDVAGRTIVGDVAKMPHLLIAGATGSGKSVCINTLIASILFKASPSEVKLLLVDPKVVELGIYNGIPHLLIPVVTDPKKAAGALNWAVIEMTNRYKLFAENNVRDLKGYNAQMKARNEATLPQIVIIIDELADLMMVAANDVEDCICRLAQMARAAGMHLVIATQRPSVDVITGVIKANIPSRISFAVSSQIDSRTILDMAGAEKLLGRGDMLFYPIGEMKPTRVQGSFITDGEIEEMVNFLKEKHTASYDQDILDKINSKEQQSAQNDMSDDDELLPQVVEMVIEYGQASASLIQRKFKVGYSRAARILDQMESWGVVGPAEGSKPRQILVTKHEWDELNS